MIDFDYLYRGLCGLARAHRANTMAGHLGAAVTAGYFFGEEHPDLDRQVYAAVEGELDRVIAGDEAIWFNAEKAGVTVAELFADVPKESPQQQRIGEIAKALEGNIDKTRQSGHNVIFASIAIRALTDHPEYATPSIVEGTVKLIAGFNRAVPGRGYYGKERGWIIGDQVQLEDAPDFPPYKSAEAMAEVVIDELIRNASLRRQGFGGLFHIINHATGLVELARCGYRDLARRGWAAHRHHVRLWRSLPDVAGELGALEPAEHDPRTPEYWREGGPTPWSARLTHRVKTLYGFFTLLRLVDDAAKRKRAEEQFLYLMA